MTCIAKLDTIETCPNRKEELNCFCKEHFYIIKKHKQYKLLETAFYNEYEKLISQPKTNTEEELKIIYAQGLKTYTTLKKCITLREQFTEKYIHPKYRDNGHVMIINIQKSRLEDINNYLHTIILSVQRIKKIKDTQIKNDPEESDNLDTKTVIIPESTNHDKRKNYNPDQTDNKIFKLMDKILDPLSEYIHPKFQIDSCDEAIKLLETKKHKYFFELNLLLTHAIDLRNRYIDIMKSKKFILDKESKILSEISNIIDEEYSLDHEMGETENKLRNLELTISVSLVDKQKLILNKRISLLSKLKKLVYDNNDILNSNYKTFMADVRKSINMWIHILRNQRVLAFGGLGEF